MVGLSRTRSRLTQQLGRKPQLSASHVLLLSALDLSIRAIFWTLATTCQLLVVGHARLTRQLGHSPQLFVPPVLLLPVLDLLIRAFCQILMAPPGPSFVTLSMHRLVSIRPSVLGDPSLL